MQIPKEYFTQLLELINQEREEERNEFEKTQSLSLSQRKKQGILWYPIHIDREEFPLKGKVLLSISKKEDGIVSYFQSGNSVSVFGLDDPKNQKVHGVVTKVFKNRVEVLFSLELLPDWIWDVELGLENFYNETTFVEMERAMQILMDPSEKHTILLRDILIGNKDPKFQHTEKFTIKEVNYSQNIAIQNLLSAEQIGLVHGPPGTGKTHTLIHLAKKVLESEQNVLLTAASNVAVDLLVAKSIQAGLSVTRIGNPARVNESLLPYTLDYKIANHPDNKTLQGYKKEAEELFRKASKFKRTFGSKEREERANNKKEARDLLKTAIDMENVLVKSILENSQVIASTLIGITFPQLHKIHFSSVIVDEATQCLEPALWIAILKTDKRIFFAGDHKQLPPTVRTKNSPLSHTLFEKLMERFPEPPVGNLLNVQYRMQEPILHFSNEHFYGNKLLSDLSIAERPSIESFQWISQGKHISFIDTAGSDSVEEMEEDSQSIFNQTEVGLIKYLLTQSDLEKKKFPFSVGVLSPYRAQVEKLKEELEKKDFLQFTPEINTIDSFQGSERDVILISLVRSNFSKEVGFLEDYRRLNVAMTRAKEELILIGDSSTLSFNHFYKQLLDYISQKGSYRTIWEFQE
jgi:superfamily I DNA and/or RNA helicase